MTQGNLRKQSICLAYELQSTIEGSQDRNSKQEPGGINRSRNHERMLPTGSLIMFFSACFIISMTTSQKWQHPEWDDPSHINHLPAYCTIDMTMGQSD